jgi:peptidoglycan/LPS O-acetylase OafA/YrhL
LLNSVQFLRALAAWLVFGHHYIQVLYNFTLTDPLSLFLQRYGSIGVDLFFVISGFIIYLSVSGKTITPYTFAVHRLARIVPAYGLFTIATALFCIYMPGLIPLTKYEPVFLLKSLFFIPAVNPSGIGFFPILTVGWTLNFEMAFYLIFMISLFNSFKFRIPILIVGLMLLCTLIPKLDGGFEFYSNKIVYEFLFGIFIALAYQKHFIQKISLKLAILLFVLAISVIALLGQVTHDPLKQGIPCAVILISALSQEKSFRSKGFFNKLGDWSYSTYLCHVMVICLMSYFNNIFGMNPFFQCLSTIVVVIIISALSFSLIEKPLITVAKLRLKNRKQTLLEMEKLYLEKDL